MSEEITEEEINQLKSRHGIRCPHCNKINLTSEIKFISGSHSFNCAYCDEIMSLGGEDQKIKLNPLTNWFPRKNDVSRDFGTLMLIGRINSFLGWLMVGGCGIAIIIGGSGAGNLVVALTGVAAIPICLLVVASGQAISCFVSIERNTKDTSDMLRDILDPSQQEEGK